MKRILVGLFFLIMLATGLELWLRSRPPGLVQSHIDASQTGQDSVNQINVISVGGDYTRAVGPRAFSFPADFGAHPDYQTEWWYYTGNLAAPDGRHFGFQLTFFRRAIAPPDLRTQRGSDWAADQIYMAHFTLTDAGENRFRYAERLERGAAGLAGAQGLPVYKVWLDDWSVEQTGTHTYHMRAANADIGLDLTLDDRKGIVLQGDHGFSQKGAGAGNASYYFSQTRLATSGTVTVSGKVYPVSGSSWMDHEFSTSALAPGQVGWDWFALQLSDGSELMVYTIRRADGSIDDYSSGTLVRADGSSSPLKKDDFSLGVQGTWHSPHSGANYPAAWRVRIPAENLDLTIKPLIADQELRVSFTYWEGAVQVKGTAQGQPVSGQGYVELTGYARSMQGQF